MVAVGPGRTWVGRECLRLWCRLGIMNNQMVVDPVLSEAEVDRIFRALADATRRDIVRRTLECDSSVSHLAASYDMSFAAVQKHVAVLVDAGLVTKRTRGRERIVSADPATIRRARSLLGEFEQLWRDRVERLDRVLAQGDARPDT